MSNWLHKHRNILLITLLALTLSVSCLANQHYLEKTTPTVSLPVMQTTQAPLSPIEQYREERDAAALKDMAALETLVNQTDLDPQTRADAAAQLQRMVSHRQKQTALEGALVQSGVYPCAAMVEEGCVTIVTGKTDLSDGETALVLTMAQLHAGVLPSGVRVITADSP